MSLRRGWTKPDGSPETEPAAGDVAILVVAVDRNVPVACPYGWTRATGSTFYKTIMPGEPDPVFVAAVPVYWAVQGQVWSGVEVAPADGGEDG